MITESDILFRDKDLVVVNKPPGLLVHRTSIAREESEFALQQIRNLLGQKVFPVHRLDRPTSGVLMFGLNQESASEMGQLFSGKEIEKCYVALVRGWFPENDLLLDHPVKSEKGKILEAVTDFHLLEKFELPIPVKPYPVSRYSMIEARPMTGRWHQIRQHLAHLRHYIINDRVHGTGHYNKMFTEQLGISGLFLHAKSVKFYHPVTHEKVFIEAPFPEYWEILEMKKTELLSS